MLSVLEDANTPRPYPLLPQAARKVGGINAGGMCRYTNNYITEQNKNHKTGGTMAIEMCIKYKQDTKEFTNYSALHELKI